MKSSSPLGVCAARLGLAMTLLGIPAISHAAGARTASPDASASSAASPATGLTLADWSAVSRGGIDPKVFALALAAASSAILHGGVATPATLTVIDYSKPSTEARMWVYDLHTHALLFHELVSHGRGSGKTLATTFSNAADSNRTSLGLFRTGEAYVGHNGYSLRLDGLEPGINDRARDRAIVIHGAPYVNAVTAKANGYLGRSLGCPAVRPEIARQLIDAVKDGGLLFAYYPDSAWLKTSDFLN